MEKRYLALPRGVNISGKNKVPMAELRQGLEALGLAEGKTHLNSGNAAFTCRETETGALAAAIEGMIRQRFSLEVPVFVTEREALAETLRHAPGWWGTGDPAIYDNLIFLLPPLGPEEALRALGPLKEGLEWAEVYGDAIFWSFRRKDYQKTNWWPRTAKVDIRDRLTIRTANTVREAGGAIERRKERPGGRSFSYSYTSAQAMARAPPPMWQQMLRGRAASSTSRPGKAAWTWACQLSPAARSPE